MGLIYFLIFFIVIGFLSILYTDWYDRKHPGWGE